MGQCHATIAHEVGPKLGRPERIVFSPHGSVKSSSASTFPSAKPEEPFPPTMYRLSSGDPETDCLPEIVAMAGASDTDNAFPEGRRVGVWPPDVSDTDNAMPDTDNALVSDADTDCVAPVWPGYASLSEISDTDNALPTESAGVWPDAFESPPTSPGLDETASNPAKRQITEAQQRQHGTVYPQQEICQTKVKNDMQLVLGRGRKPIVMR